MVNYAKGIKAVSDLMRKKAKMIADFSSNPKSAYSKMHPSKQMEHVNAVLDQISKNPDVNFDEETFLDAMRKRMFAEQKYRENTGMSLNDVLPENPDLHARNFELEKQADDFLRENDPAFFEELEQSMKNYDENVANLPSDNMLDMLQRGEGVSHEKLLNATQDEYTKKLLLQLFDDEFEDVVIPADNIIWELSKNPEHITGGVEGVLHYPKTSLNSKHHNVPIPQGDFYFGGKHKPGSYYHNALWNYINKGPDRDALLDDFFRDILHKETPIGKEKFDTIKKYKDFLDKRQLDLDMKSKPYDPYKFNNMQAIEEYFNNQRPYSFENFEPNYLENSPLSDENYRELLKYIDDYIDQPARGMINKNNAKTLPEQKSYIIKK